MRLVYLKQTELENMQPYSENQIRSLHAEFKNQKKYTAKLAFFDRLFDIIPFHFPDFDPQLGLFFQKEKMDMLVSFFKKERNNPELTEKKFLFNETFVFNIKPANSNSAAYSSYILNRFLARRPDFELLISQKLNTEKTAAHLLDEANSLINHIEYCLQHEYDKSFRLQCLSVFFKGFQDAFSNKVNLPDKKRKFIELYLYAQGIIYSGYVQSLKSEYRKFSDPDAFQRPAQLDLQGKINLLNELGIIDFLNHRYPGMDDVSLQNKLADIFGLILDANTVEKEYLIRLLSPMYRKNPLEIVSNENSPMQKA